MLINFQISKDWHWIVLPMTGAGVCVWLVAVLVTTWAQETWGHRWWPHAATGPTWQEKLCLNLTEFNV